MSNTQSPLSKRRTFIKQSAGLAFSMFTVPAIASSLNQNIIQPEKKPALSAELVFEFVRQAHFDLEKVKEMIAMEPTIVNACWDWGGGDFETALGGACHLGNRTVATYLLEKGARKDIFCAAMMGDTQLVKSFIKSDPTIVNVKGPHGFTLLFHVAISGDVTMAVDVKPHLNDIPATCNLALHAAARGGHLPMTEWLLNNGADNLNTQDFAGNTPLQTAEKKGYKEVAAILKKKGGT